jgi:Protein of unknown function (DUF 659)
VDAVGLLRPEKNLLPDRKKLSSSLLDSCYAEVKEKSIKLLSSSSSAVCLVTDGWSNIRNDPIVNYMAVSPTVSLFLESVSTGQQAHTGEWIAADIERVMSKHTDSMLSGAVTDNTSANKKAWVLLKAKSPGLFFQVCTSHGLHLMSKDILGPTKTK